MDNGTDMPSEAETKDQTAPKRQKAKAGAFQISWGSFQFPANGFQDTPYNLSLFTSIYLRQFLLLTNYQINPWQTFIKKKSIKKNAKQY